MKKIILLFSLAAVFCVSFFIDSVSPEISLGFSSSQQNFSVPEIQSAQEMSEKGHSLFYSVKANSDGNLIIGLKHYGNFFQRALLEKFYLAVSGKDRTAELLQKDISVPVSKGEINQISVVKESPAAWRWYGIIYKFLCLLLCFAGIYGLLLLAFHYRNAISSAADKDWPHETAVFFKSIDPLYAKTFVICFAAMNIVFLYHAVHFIWGNHDWNFIKYGLGWFGAVWGGRLTENFFAKLLFGGDVLPVFYNLFNFAAFSLGAVLLCILWKIPKTLFAYISVSLLLLLTPYTLSWLFMVNMIHFALPAIAMGGIYFALMAGKDGQKHIKLLNFMSVFMFLYAFFAYPPVLSTISVIFCGMLFMEFFFEHKKLAEIMQKFRFIIADILISGVFFKISLKILPYLSGNVDPNAYMTQNAGFSAFFRGFIPVLKSVFLQLVITQPFLDSSYKMTWLALAVFSVISVIVCAEIRRTGRKYILCSLLLFLLAMCASQASVFISLDKGIMFSSRIAMFGLLFFYIFAYSVLLKQSKTLFRNIAFAFFILLTIGSISRDANAQKIWKLGFDAEKQNIMNISHSIESHPEFDPDKKYIFAAFGKQHSYRDDYYFMPYDLPDERLLNYPFTPEWVPHVPFQFYAKKNYIENGYSICRGCLTPPEIQNKINEDLADFKATAKPWPAPGSVLVRGNYIAVMFGRDTL